MKILHGLILPALMMAGLSFSSCQQEAEHLEPKCTPQNEQPLKVLFLGNSITFTSKNSVDGWSGNWGMAASSQANDYVHLVMDSLRRLRPGIDYKLKNVFPWEKNHSHDLNTYKEFRDFEADMLIIRVGENVDKKKTIENKYYQHLDSLVDYFNPLGSKKVIVTSTFWRSASVDTNHRLLAEREGYEFVDLGGIGKESSNKAYGFFGNTGIGAHPGDKGMRAIADSILSAIYREGWFQECY